MHAMRIARVAIVPIATLIFGIGCHSTRRTTTVITTPAPPPEVVVVDGPGYHHPGPPDHAPANGYRQKHQYTYYPSSRVYYYPEQQRYFWLESGSWRAGPSLPSTIRIDSHEGTMVDIDGETPYAYHMKHHGNTQDYDGNHDNGRDNGYRNDNGHGRDDDNGKKGKGKHH